MNYRGWPFPWMPDPEPGPPSYEPPPSRNPPHGPLRPPDTYRPPSVYPPEPGGPPSVDPPIDTVPPEPVQPLPRPIPPEPRPRDALGPPPGLPGSPYRPGPSPDLRGAAVYRFPPQPIDPGIGPSPVGPPRPRPHDPELGPDPNDVGFDPVFPGDAKDCERMLRDLRGSLAQAIADHAAALAAVNALIAELQKLRKGNLGCMPGTCIEDTAEDLRRLRLAAEEIARRLQELQNYQWQLADFECPKSGDALDETRALHDIAARTRDLRADTNDTAKGWGDHVKDRIRKCECPKPPPLSPEGPEPPHIRIGRVDKHHRSA